MPLPDDSQPLILGQVLSGMKKDDPPVEGKKNNPMMPICWTKSYSLEEGKKGHSFTTTMGASQDLLSEGVRRILVNASYWAMGLKDKIEADSCVDVVGDYKPTPFGFKKYTKGVMPSAHALKKAAAN